MTFTSMNERVSKWAYLISLTFLSVYFFVFMEWLFLVTKPSFTDSLSSGDKIVLLAQTSIVLFGVSLLFLAALFAMSMAPFLSRFGKIGVATGLLIPTAFLSITALLMFDNFTYTVFRFGIVSTSGVFRGVYGLLFLLLGLMIYRWLWRQSTRRPDFSRKQLPKNKVEVLSFGLFMLTILIAAPGLFSFNKPNVLIEETAKRKPNILLIGSDGISAQEMPLYGSERDTTPYITDFSKTALVAKNNFANAVHTSGSIVSIFTGKLPTQTRVLFPPDILQGADSYQHLPGILKEQGYYNVEIGTPYYLDAYGLNFQDGFDLVNGQPAPNSGEMALFTRKYQVLATIQQRLNKNTAYFLFTSARRVKDRLQHIFYIHTMINPLKEAMSQVRTFTDQKRVDQILDLFASTSQPLFLHVHFMGTHGGKFEPEHIKFSAGETQTTDFMKDFYDDALLDFDTYFHDVINQLAATGALDHTIVILYTDHASKSIGNLSIPLLIRFPNGEFAGQIQNNTQNLDIAPTILDYMGLSKPDWMDGQSLLRNNLQANRPIFTSAVGRTLTDGGANWWVDPAYNKPPFYQFGRFFMIACQKWYALNVSDDSWLEGDVPGETSHCSPNEIPTTEQAQKMVLRRLKSDGFDVSSLVNAFHLTNLDTPTGQ